jgi:ADP-heptose:LPS heptosyltransferase
MQNPAIVAAVIAAIVSAGTAFWTSRFEMDKVIVAVQQSALQQIIEARLKAYPEAYQLVSQLNKDARANQIDRAYLERLRLAFDRWDSRNGYLLGRDSSDTAYEYREQLLRAILESKRRDFSPDRLLEAAERLELALRSDLGLYGIRLRGSTPALETPTVRKYGSNTLAQPGAAGDAPQASRP